MNERVKQIRVAFYTGVALALVPLVVILTQVPWLLKVYHGPRPITAAELQQYGGGQPTDDYVAFEVSESIETKVGVGYRGGKTLSRHLLVRVGDRWMLARAPAEYRGGPLVGFVQRLDARRSGLDREALDRISDKPPDQLLLPYVLQADADQKQEVGALFGVMGFFALVGAGISATARRRLSLIAKAQQPRAPRNPTRLGLTNPARSRGRIAPNEFPVRLTERSAAVFRERLRALPGSPTECYVRVKSQGGGTTFVFVSGAPAETDVVGESFGVTLAVPERDCAALAGYVIDYRSVGPNPGFILKDPRSLHSVASDPGRCQLSEGRLRRLQPELFAGAPGAAGDESGLREYRESLAEHLRNGDSRAAVVVSTAPLVVAAYTDELDCVALLRFPEHLAAELKLRVGSRLLTVNRYQCPGGARPGDLVPGPADTRRYINFTPLIADFLVADVEGLKRRKESISEAEWERAVNLSRESAARGVAPRDGRPLYCHQPATDR